MPKKMGTESNINFAQLITLYEVSRKINSQLNLHKLLDEIMDLAIQLLHAEKGLILLRDLDSGEFSVEVARAMDKRTIEDVVKWSHTIIKRVESEGQPVLLQRVPETKGGDISSSLVRYKIKSVICVPLRSRNQLIGTIYLDTTNTKHFFKKEDLFFLEAFANLAGIAIENAKSYLEIENLNTNLEKLVDNRTNELNQKNKELTNANQELKNTQLQLIRSEKMASLGLLVAGIAHEINTPLGSINSNIDMFLRGFEQLQQRLNLSNESTADIKKTLEILDNLSWVNKTACERITEIVKTLRNFARLDEEEYKTVEIHEGIDSTLSLIGHLCRDRVEIIKEYGEIPLLRCYASQLNQVFMNLLVNACQAIEGKGQIRIRTHFEGGQIHVQISDTGVGIPSENISKIYDPGFTTKGVGIGTGLGLSITYRIVEDHHGTIEVESEVGKGTTFTVNLPCTLTQKT
ncbi:MAG: ATP-binding protein [bacterium]